MAWIESHTTLREHPKTKHLCRLLKITRREGVGLLHFLWWWALDYAPEGDLSAWSDEDIADAVDWKRNAGVMMDALLGAGFIDSDRQIHDWYEFAERRIARRRANAERMRAKRATNNAQPTETRAAHVQRTCSDGVQLKTGKTGKKERPERPLPNPLPPGGRGEAPAAPKSTNGTAVQTGRSKLPALDVRTY